jgi:hypothetical protein
MRRTSCRRFAYTSRRNTPSRKPIRTAGNSAPSSFPRCRTFLANEHVRAKAQKRGGGQDFVFIDAAEARERYRVEPAHSSTPEAIFETRWAHALLEQTLSRLRSDFTARGKERLFEGLSSFLTVEARRNHTKAQPTASACR